MSVTPLVRLLETGQYEQCLQEAAALLAAGNHDQEALARIHAAICRCSLELGSYRPAAEAGLQAETLARQAGAADVLGFVLVDLATAHLHLRQYEQALASLKQYCDGLGSYVAACCMEGTALQRMADVHRRTGRPAAALDCYQQARRWFERFGDEASARTCVRALVHLHLEQGEPARALPLLQEMGLRTGGREEQCSHLLDWARYYLVAGKHSQAANTGFAALELAEDRPRQQSQAHLLLCRTALAQNKPLEAMCFAMGARVAAIDGRVYDLEFEAAEVIFGLLRSYGAGLLQAVEADFAGQGVSIYQYVSEEVVRRHV